MQKLIEISLTPEELATEFCKFNDIEQAQFFNAVAAIAAQWPGGYIIQTYAINTRGNLTQEARDFLGESIYKVS